MDTNQVFRALVVQEPSPGQFTRAILERHLTELPEDEVLVRVHFSSINYKDALSASGNKGVTRRYPHTPGIDAAGIVVDSRNTNFKPGDAVIATGIGDLGMNTPGGFGQYIRVPAEWLAHQPDNLTLHQCMIYGTAGFTAALSVQRLVKAGILPEAGEILVTGPTGGVGSIATGILAKLGYRVTAATGKIASSHFLQAMGAQEIIPRDTVIDNSSRPLLHARWAAVIDTIGGNYLASAIRATQPGGIVTTCGNAASADLTLSVYPFILRGVSLVGIDVSHVSPAGRARCWELLSGDWKLDLLDQLARTVSLDDLDHEIQRTLRGEQTGRVVVDLR